MNATASIGLDALPKEAQRLFIARCVAFSCAFLERGESHYPNSFVLAAFRRDFGADLQFFSEQLWETSPSEGAAKRLRERLHSVLEAENDLPSGVDQLDGYAEGPVFIILTACNWLMGEGGASTIARMITDCLSEVGIQEALVVAGRRTMSGRDIDASEWVDPEKKWQAQYVDRVQSGGVEDLKKLAKESAQTLIDLIPKINSVIVRSRT